MTFVSLITNASSSSSFSSSVQACLGRLNSEASRKAREPKQQTIEEFQIDPIRPFLTDILRLMAAPWKRERRDNPVGQVNLVAARKRRPVQR